MKKRREYRVLYLRDTGGRPTTGANGTRGQLNERVAHRSSSVLITMMPSSSTPAAMNNFRHRGYFPPLPLTTITSIRLVIFNYTFTLIICQCIIKNRL